MTKNPTAPAEHSRRFLVQDASVAVAGISLAWSALLIITGGFDVRFAGVTVTAHEPLRPLLAASLAMTLFVLAGGIIEEWWSAHRPLPRATARMCLALWRLLPGPDTSAWILAASLCFVSLFWGTKAVGGSDSWGYLSEAQGFSSGQLRIVQPFVREVPWPNAADSFTPLGYHTLSAYREVSGIDELTIVPYYSPGLPLLMAAAQAIGGYQAMFFVVPLLSGALIIGTYRIGKHLSSPAAGLLGAWLTAISPCVMFMMMSTMTDVPVAGAFAVGFWLLLEGGAWKALGAGIATAVAIAIRPNFAPVAAIMCLYYLPGLFSKATRAEGLLHGALFTLGVLPGPILVALVNDRLYGSPVTSGYGRLDVFFSLAHIVPNLLRYPRWLGEAQTPVAWVGLAAVFVPARGIWNGPRRFAALVISALTVLFVWGLYLIYDVYDAWWFSRFILTSWPFIMIGTASVAVAVARLRPATYTPIVVVVMFAVSVHQLRFSIRQEVFNLWQGERRYVVAAQMAARLTSDNSVIITGQHGGSVRLYAGRMTLQYLPVPPDWLDRTVAWLDEHGAHPYALLEDWEVADVRTRFRGQRVVSMLEHPIAVYKDPGTLYLYDLAAASRTSHPEVVTGTYPGFWAAPPSPEKPGVVFRPPPSIGAVRRQDPRPPES